MIKSRIIRTFCCIIVLLFCAGRLGLAYLKADADTNHAVTIPDRLIVKLAPDSELNFGIGKKGAVITGVRAFDNLNANYRVKSLKPVFRQTAPASAGRFGRVLILAVAGGTDMKAMRAAYERLPVVVYAEPDYPAELHGFSDDDFYSHQWGLNNSSQGHYHVLRRDGPENDKMIITHGLVDADVDAEEVFLNPPDKTVTSVVAIIDSGADLDHPDLAGKIWMNPGEIPDNGLDDDNNGYADDVHGWDFCATDNVLEIGAEDNDPTDEFGHGTHCAGIVAAGAGNGIGIVGVCSEARIMPLKILPIPLTSKIARAIVYAADNGADVINMSFGFPYRSYLLEEAMSYAREKGVVLCASTGNSGVEEHNHPAASQYTIAVGASNDSDRVTDFSTYGDHMSVCAPGLSILSLRADSTDMYDDDEPGVHVISDNYFVSSGTSMACPHVAGVAAWVRSISPGLTPDSVQRIIEASADDYVDPYGLGDYGPGWDIYSGYGRVNLREALQLTPSIRAHIQSPRNSAIIANGIDIMGIADGDDFERYVVEYGEGPLPATWRTIKVSSSPVTDGLLTNWNTDEVMGWHTIRLRVGDFNRAIRTVFVANEAMASIAYPLPGDTVNNIVNVTASAYSPEFNYAVLEYGEGWTPATWKELAVFSVPVVDDVVSSWVVESLAQGKYTLRLSVYSKRSLESQDEVNVVIRSTFSSDNAWKVGLGTDAPIAGNYGDFDNDGSNEIIIGMASTIKMFSPDGLPKTGDIPDFPENNFLVPIAVGNLDGDGIDDIVALGADPAMLYGFPSAESSFVAELEWSPEVVSYSRSEHEFARLFLKDIDHDGRDEIHMVFYEGHFYVVLVYGPDGTKLGSLPLASEYLSVDLDGDGSDEVYAHYEFDYSLREIEHYDLDSTVDTFYYEIDGSGFACRGLSAYDIDGDSLLEMIALALHKDRGYWLYAFDDGLNLKEGWPRELAIDDYLVPTMPIFGDLDNDGETEYFCTYFDLSVSYVHVWNSDGSPYLPEGENGLFATIPRPGVLNMLLLADMNADGLADIVACLNDDVFSTYKVQRVYAWDNQGNILPGFPLITAPEVPYHYASGFRFVPRVGDIDRDGNVDLIMPTADSALIFINFAGMIFDSTCSPVTSCRYNRRMNNVGTTKADSAQVDVDDREPVLPDDFSITQNYPNPFNPVTRFDYSVGR
ncbi:MAG: S8 family serine peptidase, partial [Candidatus Zixiibacteriota bacterium]